MWGLTWSEHVPHRVRFCLKRTRSRAGAHSWPQGRRAEPEMTSLALMPRSPSPTPDDLSADSPTLPPACLPALPPGALSRVASHSHTVPPPPYSPCARSFPPIPAAHLAAVLG